MRSRYYGTVLALAAIAVIGLAGCSGESGGKGSFAGSSSKPSSASTASPTPSGSSTSDSNGINAAQWSEDDTCAALQMSTSTKVGIQIATPFPKSKGGGCIFGGKDVTFGLQLLHGSLSEVPTDGATYGPKRFSYRGHEALEYCADQDGKPGCYIVVQAGPKLVYYLTHNQVKGKTTQNKLLTEIAPFNDAVYAGLKSGVMLHPNFKEHYPTQAQYDGERNPQRHPTIDLCNGKDLTFKDLPYDGMQNAADAGPTRFRNGPEAVDYDILCSWDVHDFVKGYTPPPAAQDISRDPSVDLQTSLKRVSDSLKNIADIFNHERAIIVSAGYKNKNDLGGPEPGETSYQESGVTVMIEKQASSDGTCRARFAIGRGAAVVVVSDSTGGRYGSPCDALRTITGTLIKRAPH